jgi:hypothetical protein
MNYARGLKRIFTVLSIGWVVVWSIVYVAASTSRKMDESDFLMFLGIAGLPVLCAFIVCFIAVPWIIAGFKKRSTNN